jgi:hypothetical protein
MYELKAELASKVARHIGSSEKLATAIPRLTLHRRTAPTAGCPVTYEPSVIVIPQGRKQVQIGGETLIYDSSSYLLTSVDLPTVARVVEASEQEPCLAVNLKLDISIVREFLSQEKFHILNVPPDSPAMSTGQVTAEFLSAWCRLLDLLSNPEDIPFLSGFIERARRSETRISCYGLAGYKEPGFQLIKALTASDTDNSKTSPNRDAWRWLLML